MELCTCRPPLLLFVSYLLNLSSKSKGKGGEGGEGEIIGGGDRCCSVTWRSKCSWSLGQLIVVYYHFFGGSAGGKEKGEKERKGRKKGREGGLREGGDGK